MLGADDALGIEDEERGKAPKLILAGDAASFQRGKIEAKLFDDKAGVGFIGVEVHAEHGHGFALALAGDFPELRERTNGPAVAARPKGEEHDFAAVVAGAVRLSVEIDGLPIDGGLPEDGALLAGALRAMADGRGKLFEHPVELGANKRQGNQAALIAEHALGGFE